MDAAVERTVARTIRNDTACRIPGNPLTAEDGVRKIKNITIHIIIIISILIIDFTIYGSSLKRMQLFVLEGPLAFSLGPALPRATPKARRGPRFITRKGQAHQGRTPKGAHPPGRIMKRSRGRARASQREQAPPSRTTGSPQQIHRKYAATFGLTFALTV